jgi:transcriptional regulator with XRE-family HTH domain
MGKLRLSIYEPEHVLLRNWLIDKRNNAGMTQRELAKRLDVVHSLVAKVEKGERRLDIVEFIIFCDALDANPCDGISLIHSYRETKKKQP